MYCFIVGRDVPSCVDFKCPIRPCNDKRAVDFLRESTDLTLRQAKKEHRNILRGVLNHKIVFKISEIKMNIMYSNYQWHIEIKEIYDRNS